VHAQRQLTDADARYKQLSATAAELLEEDRGARGPSYNADSSGDADILLQVDRKHSPVQPTTISTHKTDQLLAAERLSKNLTDQLHNLKIKLSKLQEYDTTLTEVLTAVFKGTTALKPPPDSDTSDDANWVRKVIASTAPNTPIGAMVLVLVQRSSTGNANTVLPTSMIEFGLGLMSASPSQYNLLRSSVPGILPAESTLKRHRDKIVVTSQAHNSSEKFITRLVATAKDNNVSATVLQNGWLLNDEMSIKPGLSYNRRTGEYEGFVTESIFDVATRVNAVDSADTYEKVCPELASHVSVWWYGSTNKTLNMPVMNVFTKSNSKVKPFDMAQASLDLIGRLHLHGFGVQYICTDSAQTNIVRLETMVSNAYASASTCV
jgi:hypothetical protein